MDICEKYPRSRSKRTKASEDSVTEECSLNFIAPASSSLSDNTKESVILAYVLSVISAILLFVLIVMVVKLFIDKPCNYYASRSSPPVSKEARINYSTEATEQSSVDVLFSETSRFESYETYETK